MSTELYKKIFNIDDALMRHEAARRRVTHERTKELRPLPSKAMGRASVDISNREELYKIFEAENHRGHRHLRLG